MFAGIFTKSALAQFLAVFIGNLMAASDGMQYGWSSPITPILLSEDGPVKATKVQTEWLESLYMIGAFCGLPITTYLVDKIGRKNCIILSSFTTLMVWTVFAFATKIEYFLVARFFTGIASDMGFVAMPMYIAEIADQKIRGFLSVLTQLMMLVGIILVYSIAPFVPFYITSLIGGSLLVVQLAIFPFMPDSPYYLLSKNRTEDAKKALTTLRQTKNVDEEFTEISTAVNRQIHESGKFKDIIAVKSVRKALLIMTILNGAQHLGSFSVMLMNIHTILEQAGSVYIESSLAGVIFSITMLFGAIVASFIIDKFGRKFLLITSSLLSGICLLTLAIYFTLKNSGTKVEYFSWIPIVAIIIYALAIKFGLGIVPIVLTAELFPAKMKAIGMTFADGMYVIFGFLSLQIYHILSTYGEHIPFFVFSACCFFTVFFTIFFIPETKGKTLEEIQFMLKGEMSHKPPIKDKNNIS